MGDRLLAKSCNVVFELLIVEGLQAQDGERFRRVGIKNLMAILCRHEDQEIVINPTAGFKSVVPYLTLAGMLFRKPVKYVHEYSDEVITLVNLPISFDDSLMFMVEKKFAKMESETAISLKEWRTGLKHCSPGVDTLVEEEVTTGQVTMSGLGLLLWERFKRDYPMLDHIDWQ